ncbi:MAG: chlorophyllase/cutinase-like alpha/beta fold protein, partial [Myxococcota bacterium]
MADPDCVAPTLNHPLQLAQHIGSLDTIVLSAEASVAVTVQSGGTLSGTVIVDSVDGEAVFSDLSTDSIGIWELSFSEVDCEETTTVSFVVGTEVHYEPAFLETGRIGVEYADGLRADVVQDLPAGLRMSGDTVFGVPENRSEGIFSAARIDDSVATRLRVHLPIVDGLESLPATIPEDDGAWAVIEETLIIDRITTSRGERTDIAVWVTRPEGAGPFPMIAFHHAAHYPADIYDYYTSLHRHWASHGFIVASVDSSSNVTGVPQSWQNLSDMSTFQLAAADMMLAESADTASDLHGAVDPDLIFVSGHSRGGGASLISLWERPSLMGAICFEQVSPLQTPEQDWDDPAQNGNRPFPERPVIIFSAANDLDEAWPLVDSAFDQLTGPSTLVTLHGTNHEYTYDADTPGSYTSSSAISFDERHELDQRWSTAFLRRHAYGEIGWDALLHGPEGLESDLSTPGV